VLVASGAVIGNEEFVRLGWAREAEFGVATWGEAEFRGELTILQAVCVISVVLGAEAMTLCTVLVAD
jgi:hypothetical protein